LSYEASDLLTIELAPWLRRVEKTFFPGGRGFNPFTLVGWIVSTAAEGGASRAQVVRKGEWWGVVGNVDWLGGSVPDFKGGVVPVSRAVFERILSIPGQQNSMRPETWLVAFASSIVLTSDEGQVTVLGSGEGWSDAFTNDEAWQRGVFFKLANATAL
jgi:hypothetical protein